MANKTIPAFSLARHISQHKHTLLTALEAVIDHQQFVGGTYVEQFEAALAAYLGVSFVISCNSGTDALWMALAALQLPQQAIVLTTPFSFIASSSEIVAHGAHPVFIDIEADTFTIDPHVLEQWLIDNAVMHDTKALHKKTGLPIVGIITVDLFGQCADYTAIKKLADEWHLWIVEDCAQAIGATLHNQKAGTFGTIGTFSFYPTKNLGAFGDAGCCVTNDPLLATALLKLRNHGRHGAYAYESRGINSRMDGLQAAVLRQQLPLLDDRNSRRNIIAKRYTDGLRHIPFIQTPRTTIGSHVYHQYVIRVQDQAGNNYRNQLECYLAKCGVQTRIFYPQPLSAIPFLRTHPTLHTVCPVADHMTSTVLSLPMWPELTDEEIDYVINTITTMNIL